LAITSSTSGKLDRDHGPFAAAITPPTGRVSGGR
jgi:hypothetical protein